MDLQAQGFRSKSKPLEEVLKSIHKMEPKLIGYDEAPIDVTAPDAIPFDELKLQEPSRIQSNLKVHPITDEPKKRFSPTIGSRRQTQPPLEAVVGNDSCNLDKQGTGIGWKSFCSLTGFYHMLTVKYFSQMVHARKQQGHSCTKFALLTVGSPHLLSVSMRLDQAT